MNKHLTEYGQKIAEQQKTKEKSTIFGHVLFIVFALDVALAVSTMIPVRRYTFRV